MGGGRLREVVSHGGSTVFKIFFLRDGLVEEGCANLEKESP